MNKSNNQAWNTKYGPRRVRHEEPTLDEAIAAAKGLSDELNQQAEIAASLIGLPPDQVRTELLKLPRRARASSSPSRLWVRPRRRAPSWSSADSHAANERDELAPLLARASALDEASYRLKPESWKAPGSTSRNGPVNTGA